jgi:hypothetical protein
MIELTKEQLKQIIIDAFNEGLIYDLNFDSPANKYAEYILNEINNICVSKI